MNHSRKEWTQELDEYFNSRQAERDRMDAEYEKRQEQIAVLLQTAFACAAAGIAIVVIRWLA